MIKVMGWRRKKGSFVSEDKRTVEYDNIELYIFTNEVPEVNGYFCDMVKVPFKQESLIGTNNFSDLLNQEIELVYQVLGVKEPKLTAVRLLPGKEKA